MNIQANVLIKRLVQKGMVTRKIKIFLTLFDCLEIKYAAGKPMINDKIVAEIANINDLPIIMT